MEEELYPVIYNFVEWFKEDCSDIFVNCYHSKSDLNFEGGVYLGDGMWVYPDGKMEQF